jgi:anaerobic ribonucleoside-triphosphate reductase
MMNLCAEILIKKFNIIKKRLSSNHLPICNGTLKEGAIFDLEKQDLSIGVVGLNEAVKTLTNHELHENNDSFNFGIDVIKEIHDTCNEMSDRDNKKYSLNEISSELVDYRFARLDLKHFPSVASLHLNEKRNHYTSSAHYRDNIVIESIEDIFKLGKFHQLIQNGVMESISLNILERNKLELKDFILKLSEKTDITRVKFVK